MQLSKGILRGKPPGSCPNSLVVVKMNVVDCKEVGTVLKGKFGQPCQSAPVILVVINGTTEKLLQVITWR